MDPYQRLAAGILKQAAEDLKKARKRIKKYENQIEISKLQDTDCSDEMYRLAKLRAIKDDLMQFFEGEWCEWLCSFVGLNHESVLQAIRAKGDCS